MSPTVKKIVFDWCFFATLLLFCGLFLYMVHEFITAFLIASFITFLAYPIYQRILSLIKSRQISSLLTIIVVIVCVVTPIVFLLFLGYEQAMNLFVANQQMFNTPQLFANPELFATPENHTASKGLIIPPGFNVSEISDALFVKLANFLNAIGVDLSTSESILKWLKEYIGTKKEYINTKSLSIIQNIFSSGLLISKNFFHMIVQLSIMLICSFYLFFDGKRIFDFFVKLIPLETKLKQKLFTNLLETLQLSVKSVSIIGLVQGFLGAIVLLIAGFESYIFLGVIMAVLSIIPAVGVFVVLLPTVIILWAQSSVGMAVFVLISCVVIGSVDQILRPLIMGKKTQLHDLMILISTLAGIQIFGIIGFVLGPAMASILTSLLRFYPAVLKSNQK